MKTYKVRMVAMVECEMEAESLEAAVEAEEMGMTMTVQQNNGWISVIDQLPDTEREVLGCCQLIGAVTVLVVSLEEYDEGYYWVAIAADGYPDYGNAVDVTHWQPLPKLPR